VEVAADVEVGLEAAAEYETADDEADSTATARSLAVTDRNRARRDQALQCKDDPKPSSKWCGRCLKDLFFSCYIRKRVCFLAEQLNAMPASIARG
jgi:hypothetical protein